jgi:bacillopeptidase F (M6 metalloprotease family)
MYCGFDFGGVLVNNTTVDQFDLCGAADTNGWVQRSVDLSAYAGQNVALQIRVETDSSLNSNLFIDDVALSAAARAYPVVQRPSTAQIAGSKAAAGVARTAGGVPGAARLWPPTAVEK